MSIKGDGPGAYHHDDRLEEWFQAHNEKSGFDTRYPGCKWEHFEDFKEDFQENGWINAKEIEPDRWGTYRRFETGWMRMGKDACTAAPWSVDDSGQPVNNFGCPTPNALVEFWSMAFETYCIDMANEFEPGKFDPIKEMMPNYEPPASSADGGKIDLGCIITVQTDFIPKLLNGYKAAAGGVAFNVREDTSIPLVKDLLSGCYDVVFCAKGNEDPDLAYVPVLTQKVVVAMSSDCPLVEKEFVTPTDLLEQHLITYVDTIPLGRAVRRMLDECGIKNVEYSYLDESILAGFAANGVEAAVMLDTFLLRSVDDVVVRPFYPSALDRRSCHHRVYMAYSTKNYHPYRVDHFIQHVIETKALKPDPNACYID